MDKREDTKPIGSTGEIAALRARMDARFEELQAQLDRRLEAMHVGVREDRARSKNTAARVENIETDMGTLLAIMRGTEQGASYFVRLAKFLRTVALFLSPFIAVWGALWAVFHGKPPSSGG